MRIDISSQVLGILIGNQIASIGWFIINLLSGKGILVASAVYGLTSAIIIYPTILISLIYNRLRKKEWTIRKQLF